MASTYKNFLNNDIASTRTLLHEAIPITGSIVSGTYLENGDIETNIKNYSHGQFQSVFDYPHLSSSANHIFDIAIGYSNDSSLSGSGHVQNAEKINMYNQMSLMLVGPDENGNIRKFDRNGEPTAAETSVPDSSPDESKRGLTAINKFSSGFFVNFARLLTKDEIKKQTFSIDLYTGSIAASSPENGNITRIGDDDIADGGHLILQDHGAATSYYVNSPAGEYGLLYSQSADTTLNNKALGLVYYQAGIAFITSSIFRSNHHFDADVLRNLHEGQNNFTHISGAGDVNNYISIKLGAGAELSPFSGSDEGSVNRSLFGMVPNSTLEQRTGSVETCFMSASISASCGGFRNAIHEISFNNTTELNSTIYFCRASHNEFNYSSNPTYVDQNSKIRVKETSFDQPATYITSIGLYSADNELLAVAKLSEPIKKTPENELTFRVRLDY